MACRAIRLVRRSGVDRLGRCSFAGPASAHAAGVSQYHSLASQRQLGAIGAAGGTRRRPSNASWSRQQQQRRSLFIQTEDTPNPNSIKFHPGRTVLPEDYGTGFFCTKGDADSKRSPLARKVFAEIEYVNGVFLGRDFITLTKTDEMSWKLVRPMALSVIMDFFAENKPVITEAPVASDTAVHEDDDEVVAMIKELIEERIRPSVQDDGGDIFFKGFDRDLGLVKLQLAGSCKGCPSSSVTLKQGVEAMLMHYVPEVQGIQEIVDDELQELNQKEATSLEQKLAKAGIPYAD
eukprot:TRINITY_DN5200_c0_g1_i1.p1 TRINITY_DN5200_c0_g1~~TRINITY_DN5200_c0_g1_i1.p1  ORF type:complete len:292 (+),score=92.11 TRINITY_DN5200_c0_g1_i1:107-982(+)